MSKSKEIFGAFVFFIYLCPILILSTLQECFHQSGVRRPKLEQKPTWEGGMTLMFKAFTWRFVLWRYESRKFPVCHRIKATVDVHGYVIINNSHECTCICIIKIGTLDGVYWHISVGFCVARSWQMGNARACSVERATRFATHAFSFYVALSSSSLI